MNPLEIQNYMASFNADNIKSGNIAQWLTALSIGSLDRSALAEMALANAKDPSGEGECTFLSIEEQSARQSAQHQDLLAKTGAKLGSLSGIPISIKDLFDQKGRTTTSGSIVRCGASPAIEDSEAIKRLQAAGAVIIGRTNMTEFAYSGLGLNPHYGTPRNPYSRHLGLIPGGSSSGSAISVTDGMALAAIGSDTGGSLRIPAALCGLVGFKPTQARMPMQGVFPLSETLDTIGPIARSVDCCARIDAVLAGENPAPLVLRPASGIRLGMLNHMVLDDLDSVVASSYSSALSQLSQSGVSICEVAAEALDDIATINHCGGFAAIESYANLREVLDTSSDQFDPHIFARMMRGQGVSAATYIDMIKARRLLKAKIAALDEQFDALICPTCPIVAPSISSLEENDRLHQKVNRLLLRNPSIANLLDRPSISIPCHHYEDLPVGFMIIGKTGEDRNLLELAATIERIISPTHLW